MQRFASFVDALVKKIPIKNQAIQKMVLQIFESPQRNLKCTNNVTLKGHQLYFI